VSTRASVAAFRSVRDEVRGLDLMVHAHRSAALIWSNPT